ncbi:MAG: hypothetical protein ABFC77_14100 [Thermoguttaceae bacterium]
MNERPASSIPFGDFAKAFRHRFVGLHGTPSGKKEEDPSDDHAAPHEQTHQEYENVRSRIHDA